MIYLLINITAIAYASACNIIILLSKEEFYLANMTLLTLRLVIDFVQIKFWNIYVHGHVNVL